MKLTRYRGHETGTWMSIQGPLSAAGFGGP